jgi:hypothetical protein
MEFLFGLLIASAPLLASLSFANMEKINNKRNHQSNGCPTHFEHPLISFIHFLAKRKSCK